VRLAEVREAGTRGVSVGVKRGASVGGGRAAKGRGCGYVANVFCAASGAGRGREKRVTYAGDARPAMSRGPPPVLREVRMMDGAMRNIRRWCGDEGVRDPVISLTGQDHSLDSGRLIRVRDAPEEP
jgi:hypothetical protein